MKRVLLALSALLMLTGLVLIFIGRRHKTPEAPRLPTFNPIYWFQPWNIPKWLTPTGLRLWFAANACIMAGAGLGALAMGLPSIFD